MMHELIDFDALSATSLNPWEDITWAEDSTERKVTFDELKERLSKFQSSGIVGKETAFSHRYLFLRREPAEYIVQALYRINADYSTSFARAYHSNRIRYTFNFTRAVHSLLQSDLSSTQLTEWEQEQIATSSSSTPQRTTLELEATFRQLFAAGREEVFEDGMQTDFSRNLALLVDKYGDEAIAALNDLINNDDKANSEVASEALRWIGRIESPLVHQQRLWLLERSLNHPSARVRDGAALGLAFMDDPSAIPYLERAIEKEHIVELRQDMEQVLQQLKDTLLESAT